MREMKDSGVPWIGEIPKGWSLRRIGQMYKERRTKVSDKVFEPLSVTMKGVVPQLSTAAKTDAHDDRKLVRKGDFAINSRSDRRGSCGIAPQDGSVSLINTILCPLSETNSAYLNWLFHSTLFADEFYRWGHGIVDDLWTTNWSDMKRIYIPYPSLPEQQRIADFLDTKCTEIESMLEKTRASIEEYKALKWSVITEAVTKGVRGERSMKDSGVEWIGEIPAEWEMSTLGRVSNSVRNGYVGPTRDLFVEDGIRYIQSLHIKEGIIDFSRQEYYVPEDWASKRPKIKTDDLLIVQTGDIGQVALVKKEYDGCNCHALIIVDLNESLVFPLYLSYYLRSHVGKELLLQTKTGALLPHLNSGRVVFTEICLPPIAEQQEIATYLDEKCVAIDSLIASKEALIAELEAYKKSLIYEYVTGKKVTLEY